MFTPSGVSGGENALTINVVNAPEPAVLALMAIGLAGIGYRRRGGTLQPTV